MKICLVDERLPLKAEEKLLDLGFDVMRMPSSNKLSTALCSHPDMLCFYHKKRLITSAEYCESAIDLFANLASSAGKLHFEMTADIFSDKYPNDAIFNALVIGENIFLKDNSVSRAIINYAVENNLKIHPVKQGYPACTVLPLDSSHAITSDFGMARAMRSAGITVTKIRQGSIMLPPHEYGFIGGASGVHEKTVFFIGNIDTHPDYPLISKAIYDIGYNLISLCEGPLLDLGRLIFIEGDACDYCEQGH